MILSFFDNNKRNFGFAFESAIEKAEEKFREAQNEIYNEGEYANCETDKDLDSLLRDKAERVTAEFEEVLREEKELNEDITEQLKFTDTLQEKVKDALEDSVPSEFKMSVGF